jgi:hypothetical protein
MCSPTLFPVLHLRPDASGRRGIARPGLTLVEVLVVMGLMGGLLGLLMPAVQMGREAATRTQCRNQLRQIGAGLYHADAVHCVMPPAIGFYPPGTKQAYGTAWLHLLPFVEQEDLYRQGAGPGGMVLALNNSIYSRPVKLFQCPADPSLGTGVLTDPLGNTWGAGTYAANAQVFCIVYADGPFQGWYQDSRGTPGLAFSFLDGTSNTILAAEKYARCDNVAFSEGGNSWAYWLTNDPNTKPYHAGFGISWTTYSIGPGSRFLVQPNPYTGPLSECDPTLASTPHRDGMSVVLADGSVRGLAPEMSGATWWAACTPAAGDLLGTDW